MKYELTEKNDGKLFCRGAIFSAKEIVRGRFDYD